MIKLRPSTQAIIGLILVIISLAVLALSIALHPTADSSFEQLLARQTADSMRVPIAILRVSSYTAVLAAIAIIFGSSAFRMTRGNDRRSNKIALATIILSITVFVACLTSTTMYVSLIRQMTQNIDTRSDEERVQDFLSNDINVVFGTTKEYTDTSGRHLIKVPVTVISRKPEAKDYIIIFDAIDKTGKRIAQNSIYTARLGARQSQGYTAAFYNLSPDQREAMQTATYKITHITEQ